MRLKRRSSSRRASSSSRRGDWQGREGGQGGEGGGRGGGGGCKRREKGRFHLGLIQHAARSADPKL